MNSPASPAAPTKWVHRFSWNLSIATLGLIFVGGLVNSTDSGLAVPDWPLSYGQLMPPMVGGILFEHGHRMVAAAVGFLTVLLAIFISFKESRTWIKRAAWTAVGLVVLQGVLGGVTVLFLLPKPISITHACLAQTFFSLVVALTVWTSPTWLSPPLERKEPSGAVPLHQLTKALFIALFVQLILGAILRHTGWGFILHVAGAVVSFSLTIWTTLRIVIASRAVCGVPKQSHELDCFETATRRPRNDILVKLSWTLLSAMTFQIALGITTYVLLGHEFAVIPIPFSAIVTITLHVMTGALVLGLSLVLALLSHRTKPSTATPPLKKKLSDYFELTKPGISFMALISSLAGFVMGSKGDIQFSQLIHTGLGILMVASGACTLNMLIEIDVDGHMNRTKNRPLPAGRLKPGEALFLGSLLSAGGVLYLGWAVNLLTGVLSAVAISVYLYVYTPLKKVTSLCTLAGAVAGALPPVMGWTAATNHFGVEASVLFSILFFWQFPHFFSLAWLYKDDYARAGLTMLPIIKGESEGLTAATSALVNSVLLLVVSCVPTFLGLTGKIYLIVAVGLGLWMTVTSFFFLLDRSVLKARKVFFASILYVPLLLIAMVLNRLPF